MLRYVLPAHWNHLCLYMEENNKIIYGLGLNDQMVLCHLHSIPLKWVYV